MIGIVAMLAAAADPAALPPIGAWQPGLESGVCVARRSFGTDPAPVTLALRRVPLNPINMVALIVPPGGPKIPISGTAELRSVPAAWSAKARFREVLGTAQTPRTIVLTLEGDAPADLATTEGASLAIDGAPYLALDRLAPADGLAALERCSRALAIRWGVSAAELDAVARSPVARPASATRHGGYPPDARRRGAQGAAIAVAAIDAKGAVTGCTIASTSGDKALDAATCALVRDRRYDPGRDVGGAAVPSHAIERVAWTLG